MKSKAKIGATKRIVLPIAVRVRDKVVCSGACLRLSDRLSGGFCSLFGRLDLERAMTHEVPLEWSEEFGGWLRCPACLAAERAAR